MRAIACEADLGPAIERLLAIEPAFAPLVGLAGRLPLRKLPAGYDGLAGIVVSQMVSRASADAIWKRLMMLLGDVTPQGVLARSPGELRAAGLSAAKERALRALAEACAEGLDLARTATLPADAAVAELTALRGIGPWTAEVYLLFAAGHPDIFPAGDVALRSAAAQALALPERPGEKAMRELSLRWQPERSIAARLLWAFYAIRNRRDAIPVV